MAPFAAARIASSPVSSMQATKHFTLMFCEKHNTWRWLPTDRICHHGMGSTCCQGKSVHADTISFS